MPRKHFSTLLAKSFSLKLNIFANFFGNAVMTVASIVFVPIYLRYIGVEAYGLVGFFASFQAILAILDLGLNVTITRELALRDGVEEKAQESRNLVRTLEIIYWGISLGLGLLALLFVPLLTVWVNPQQLSPETVRTCFVIMSLMVVLQFPINFYLGGLFGLQRQVLASLVTILSSLFRYVGALAVLHFISSRPEAFFIWQVISSGVQVLILVLCLWLTLPKTDERARFQKSLFRDIWKFTTGMGGIAIVSVLLMQLDKIVLVKILPLETFGYYSIASVVATAIYRLIFPVFQAYLPRFSQIVGKAAEAELSRLYHQGCQVMAIVILPLSAMLVFFPREIIFLWQQNAETAERTAVLVSLLTVGYALGSLIYIPYALQLANGWTKLYFYTLLITLFASIPAMVLLSLRYGANGAALVLIITYASFVFVMIPLMHRRLLPAEKWKWYAEDVFLPLVGAFGTGLLARLLFVDDTLQIVTLLQLAIISGIVFLVTALATPYSRHWLMNRLRAG